MYAVHMNALALMQGKLADEAQLHMALIRAAQRKMEGRPTMPEYSLSFRLLCHAADWLAPAVLALCMAWEVWRLTSS